MIQAGNDRMTEVTKDLREAQAKLADVVPRLQAGRDVLGRTNIRSPYAGYVVDLAVFSMGAVIQRGDKVMDIVPSQNNLVAEANVNVDDIHEVHPGMRAEMHFTAYKQRVIPHGRPGPGRGDSRCNATSWVSWRGTQSGSAAARAERATGRAMPAAGTGQCAGACTSSR